jgi:hypothetical protein
MARTAQHFFVLLLAHPLAAFFDQRTHKTGDAIGFVGKNENPLP